MHPWLVHSGTTNLRSIPRLLANGMVRIKKKAFDTNGHPLLQARTTPAKTTPAKRDAHGEETAIPASKKRKVG